MNIVFSSTPGHIYSPVIEHAVNVEDKINYTFYRIG